MTPDNFQQYSEYYDLLYQDKSYSDEALIKSVLEFGSGTGRHGRLLGKHGFHVLGVERSEPMVTAARDSSASVAQTSLGSFECVQSDIRDVKINREFDAVISLFHVIGYQTSNEDVLRTFASAARHLRPEGRFMFDVWHGPGVLSMRPSVRIKRVENDKLRLTRIAEPDLDTNTSVVTVRYTVFAESKADGQFTTFGEEHRMRYFSPVEIQLFAVQSGFEVEKSEEFLTMRPPSEQTWGVMYLLRKGA
jgi:SAM-dependent methyltransferase